MTKEKSIVEKINEENVAKYGEIKKCCDMFPQYCRCENLTKENSIKLNPNQLEIIFP